MFFLIHTSTGWNDPGKREHFPSQVGAKSKPIGSQSILPLSNGLLVQNVHTSPIEVNLFALYWACVDFKGSGLSLDYVPKLLDYNPRH
jgi:hypothetical protein